MKSNTYANQLNEQKISMKSVRNDDFIARWQVGNCEENYVILREKIQIRLQYLYLWRFQFFADTMQISVIEAHLRFVGRLSKNPKVVISRFLSV